MAKKHVILVLSALAFWGAYKVAIILTPPPIPELDENAYWGPGKPKADDPTIKPFKINVPEQVIEDLNRRLNETKDLTAPLEGIQFQYGFNTNALKNILTYWRKEYKWREREQFLNQFPQFKTQIQGLDIHFIHIKPKLTNEAKRTLPLLLMHGWPGSIREFYSLIPLLTAKPQGAADFVFELMIPSLPGYGFSQASSKPGLGSAEMAVIFKHLMKRLGHDKFYIQGGDWGALIAEVMATVFPDNILGHHSNMCGAQSPMVTLKMIVGSFMPSLVIDEKHQERLYPLGKRFSYLLEETGYMHLQATKPDTVGVALSDSPAGLAAYILEKFVTWTEPKWKATPDGSLTKKFTYTDLLDNVMIYWVTNSITTSMRMYSESLSKRHMSLQISSIPTNVPTACARFKNELMYMPDSFLKEKYTNLIQTTDYEDGGHFAAFELPDVLAEDIWSAFVKIIRHK